MQRIVLVGLSNRGISHYALPILGLDTSPHSNVISVRPLFGPAHDVPVQAVEGEHGGADPLLRSDLFTGPSAQSLELGL
ncbi:MAG TPA: hypothetical protein PKM36_12860, partial [Propionibacteriaceae bacterium]|nr:hypothetical protein [Propionibacteriaceae bacterium]